MLKNINWNVSIPVLIFGLVAFFIGWFLTKPGGMLNKFDGEYDLDDEGDGFDGKVHKFMSENSKTIKFRNVG